MGTLGWTLFGVSMAGLVCNWRLSMRVWIDWCEGPDRIDGADLVGCTIFDIFFGGLLLGSLFNGTWPLIQIYRIGKAVESSTIITPFDAYKFIGGRTRADKKRKRLEKSNA